MLNGIAEWLRSNREVRRSLDGGVVLPDFRNVGVMFRIVVLAEALRFVFSYAGTGSLHGAYERIMHDSPFFEPGLLLAVLVLFILSPILLARPYRVGVASVLVIAGASTSAWRWFQQILFGVDQLPGPAYVVSMSVLLTLAVLAYFNWRHRVLSPALTEARLMALQARIRPHFLFNSLNTVLGLIRVEPRRAEAVLENLAELYRALLSEAGALVPLGREIDLARAYAEIETMRLGPRLTVNWQYQGAPLDALVPPLIIQPLLENAVYHGVEPSESGGSVYVTIFMKGEQVNLVVRNPCDSSAQRRSGNRMALDNIRERLALHFDAEAEMSAYEAGGEFVVQIRIPYKHV